MKKAGNALMAIGFTLFILGSCYLDSDSYIFLVIAFIGLALLYEGYQISERRKRGKF